MKSVKHLKISGPFDVQHTPKLSSLDNLFNTNNQNQNQNQKQGQSVLSSNSNFNNLEKSKALSKSMSNLAAAATKNSNNINSHTRGQRSISNTPVSSDNATTLLICVHSFSRSSTNELNMEEGEIVKLVQKGTIRDHVLVQSITKVGDPGWVPKDCVKVLEIVPNLHHQQQQQQHNKSPSAATAIMNNNNSNPSSRGSSSSNSTSTGSVSSFGFASQGQKDSISSYNSSSIGSINETTTLTGKSQFQQQQPQPAPLVQPLPMVQPKPGYQQQQLFTPPSTPPTQKESPIQFKDSFKQSPQSHLLPQPSQPYSYNNNSNTSVSPHSSIINNNNNSNNSNNRKRSASAFPFSNIRVRSTHKCEGRYWYKVDAVNDFRSTRLSLCRYYHDFYDLHSTLIDICYDNGSGQEQVKLPRLPNPMSLHANNKEEKENDVDVLKARCRQLEIYLNQLLQCVNLEELGHGGGLQGQPGQGPQGQQQRYLKVLFNWLRPKSSDLEIGRGNHMSEKEIVEKLQFNLSASVNGGFSGLGNGVGVPGKIGGALPPLQAQPPLPGHKSHAGSRSGSGSGMGMPGMIPRKMPSLASLQQPMYHNPGGPGAGHGLQHHVSQPQLQSQLQPQHSGNGNNKFVFTNNISSQQAQKQQKHARQLSNSLNSPVPSLPHLNVELSHSHHLSSSSGMGSGNGGMGMGMGMGGYGHGRNFSVASCGAVSVHSGYRGNMDLNNNNNNNNNNHISNNNYNNSNSNNNDSMGMNNSNSRNMTLNNNNNNSNTIMETENITSPTTAKHVPFKRLDSNGPIPMSSFDDVHNAVPAPLPKTENDLVQSTSAPASTGTAMGVTGPQQQQQQPQPQPQEEEKEKVEEKLTKMFSEVNMIDTNDICLIDDHEDEEDASDAGYSFENDDDNDSGSILATPPIKHTGDHDPTRAMSMDQIVGGLELGDGDLMDIEQDSGDAEEEDVDVDAPTQPLFFGSTPCLVGSGPASPLIGSSWNGGPGVAGLTSGVSVSSPALNLISGSGIQTTIGTTADLPFFGANPIQTPTSRTGSEMGDGTSGSNSGDGISGETIRCKVVRGEEMMMIKLPLNCTLHLLKLSILTNYVTGDPRQSLKLFDDLKLSCLLGKENGGGVVKLGSNQDLKFCLDLVCAGSAGGKAKKGKLVVRVE
ncbi:unnamed protein product [Ambrosiozyma monospora]|uniref:Unnamed protein product n=1 Tax=Ambrosiozyma monospora TaxID=43982 RepID=A0A9W6YNZ7_AMBMO|nr:unnamed protein product [Ambrosiozyma monospora]